MTYCLDNVSNEALILVELIYLVNYPPFVSWVESDLKILGSMLNLVSLDGVVFDSDRSR